MFESILFYAFSIVLIGAAAGVVFARNPVHAVMFLVLTFFQSACLWLLAEAEFLAIVLVLVYVGAVMVLFLFVVMMLDIKVEEVQRGFTRYAWLGVGVSSGDHEKRECSEGAASNEREFRLHAAGYGRLQNPDS